MADKGSEDRVAYSIDMSVDLGNASHFDVGDSSQGFSVWTEEVPGKAANWFFVMPNLFGNNNGAPFNGVAVKKLYHGTAISWDGRVIRHCTSLTCPDETGKPYGGGDHPTLNHVYGTFSAAKERIVNAGRCRAAAAAAAGCPVTASGDKIIAPHVGVDVVGAAGVNGDDNSNDGIKCFHLTSPKLRMRTLTGIHRPKMARRNTGCVFTRRRRVGIRYTNLMKQ
ncbi:hypothetical protein MHU86_11287 [Fragilaria crotonensis]|nr:hypothetical protein MHU86_11287 [Fragilaria crotonensis]